VSLPTIDDDARSHFEPRASSVSARLSLLEKLRDAGVETFAVVQPMLPGDPRRLADALAERVSSVSIDVLHGVEGAEREFAVPAYAIARRDTWQRQHALELRNALLERGIDVWSGELPPDLVRC
jgi:DNA repair photolyase